MLDNLHSIPAGKFFTCVSVGFVAITAVGLCLSTIPDIGAKEEQVSRAVRTARAAGLAGDRNWFQWLSKGQVMCLATSIPGWVMAAFPFH